MDQVVVRREQALQADKLYVESYRDDGGEAAIEAFSHLC